MVGGIEKNLNSFVAALPEENKLPSPYPWKSLQNPNNYSTPTYKHFFKKITPSPPFKKEGGEAQTTKHSVVSRVFLHILVYVYLLHSMHSPILLGGWDSYHVFEKGKSWQDLNF